MIEPRTIADGEKITGPGCRSAAGGGAMPDLAASQSVAPRRHAPGIYFDLPESDYHQDDALGSTAIKGIAVDPYEWQFDNLYGEDSDTDAKTFGSAIHKRFLEGPEAFRAAYCQDMPAGLIPDGALDTTADLKRFLSERGIKGLSTKLKADLIKAVLDIDPAQPIVATIKEKWLAENSGKTVLTAKRWAQVEVAARWAQRDPLLSEVMKDGTFVEGAPEVSVFYEDRGVRLKARFDRLLRHAIVDIKTFAPLFDGQLEKTFLKTIDRMHYDVQCAAYLRAWQHARSLFKQKLVFGNEPFDGFLRGCFDRAEPSWIWIMIKSKGAPQPLVVDWKATFARSRAAEQVEDAINKYIELRDTFGADQEWVPIRPAVTIQDHDLPTYFGV